MTLTKAAQAQRDADRNHARELLRKLLKPGMSIDAEVVYTSASGTSSDVRLRIADIDDRGVPYVRDITGLAVTATGNDRSPRDRYSMRIGEWGTSPTFMAVYSLARSLWPDGHPCTGHDRTTTRTRLRCPSNDHANGERTYSRGKMHRDGGYALTRA